jgi:REP element-mobilizing transposase RayT
MPDHLHLLIEGKAESSNCNSVHRSREANTPVTTTQAIRAQLWQRTHSNMSYEIVKRQRTIAPVHSAKSAACWIGRADS